jgi:hydroxymethylglutaryl-CoA reductase (NADPH)
MSYGDRRTGRRLTFGEDEILNAHLRAGNAYVVARIMDISRDAMRVRPREGDGVEWTVGMPVRNVRLFAGDEMFRALGDLIVSAVDSGGKRGTTILLAATNEVGRAWIWLAMEDIFAGDSGMLGVTEAGIPDVPRIPARGLYTESARMERLDYARSMSGTLMRNAAHTRLDPRKLTGNIENLIGSVEIPVGLAGPLRFKGQKARGFIFAPLATTEGALVASVTRGARAISESSGVTTRVVAQRMLRVPLFVLSDMRGASLFASWVRDHVQEIRGQVRQVSRHANLVSIRPSMLGNMVHVSFVYETGDAAGQNMTTTTTWHACQWLMAQMKPFNEIRFENFIIEANLSGDKKVAFQSFIEGRGTRVVAECFLTRQVIEKVLKLSPEQLIRATNGFLAGSVQAGMVGFNINIANVIGSMFAATGQDIACVHESSVGQLHLVPADDGVYASMLLPALIVGTVGGGTGLPNQHEYLDLMGCAGPDKVGRFAEIIAGFCLALDLSTLSAIASGQFATAHEKLGRNRPTEWFTKKDLDRHFFERHLRRSLGDDGLRVTGSEPVEGIELGSSILTELTARKVDKLVGHFPWRIEYRTGRGEQGRPLDVLIKSKPLDDEVILMLNSMAAMCGPRLAAAYARSKDKTGFKGCNTVELDLYAQRDPRFRRHVPAIYGIHRDDDREAFLLIMERLQGMLLMDSADDVSGWKPEHIEAALRGIAQIHAVWFGREDELRKTGWLPEPMTTAAMVEMAELWEAIGVHAVEEFPSWFHKDDLKRHRRVVGHLARWWKDLEELPRTLIHNDFNPRNLCLRPLAGGEQRLCVYDWELATIGVPQHDVAEFLAFVMSPKSTEDEVSHYVGVHRKALEQASGIAIPSEQGHLAYRRSLQDLAVNRFAMYAMAHTFRHYGFMERISKTLRHLLRLETGE